jgi:hypothetical protein
MHNQRPLRAYMLRTILTVLFMQVTGGGARRSGLFPDDFFHLGGDEVDTSCWDLTPSVAAWLEVGSPLAYAQGFPKGHQGYSTRLNC